MNTTVILILGFLLRVIIIFGIVYGCFSAIEWCYKKFGSESRRYVEIFSVTSENQKIDSPTGICTSIEYEYFVTVYGLTRNGKRKVLAKTLMYRTAEIAEREGNLLEKVLRKRYHIS